mgnify:CR=1 FL=1
MDILQNPILIWFLLGILFLILEFTASNAIVLLFFGIGSLLTSLLVLIGLIPDEVIWLQLTVFIGSSVLTLIILRKYFKKAFIGFSKDHNLNERYDQNLAGLKVEVVEDINEKRPGKVKIHGAIWKASRKLPAS